jgi:hypothetical protein
MNGSFLFRILLGYGGKTPNPIGLQRVLEGARFYGPVSGVYGNVSTLDLAEGARAMIRSRNIDDPSQWDVTYGTWLLYRGGVKIYWPGEESPRQLSVGDHGVLIGVDEAWSSQPSECGT